MFGCGIRHGPVGLFERHRSRSHGRDRRRGILGGGDLAAPTELSNNVARSRDGGLTWETNWVMDFSR